MPLFGAHMSIAGGYYKAAESAREHKSDTVQLFTKNNNQWKGKPISDEDVRLFRDAVSNAELRLPMGHVAYLINLASPDPALFEKSFDAFVEEVTRAEKLGLSYLVMHPGAATDGDEDAGLRRIAAALDETHRRCSGFKVLVLLENTAGQGSALGHRFEHLRRILDGVKQPERLGVCLDTCHLLAAGYPLATQSDYQATFDDFDRVVGLNVLRAFHVNDSKKPLGSRVDRHEHIGQGCLGLEPFRMLVNDARFQELPMVLETPKENDSGEMTMDRVNLATLRKLCRRGRRP
jgi:deoxyribonuclease-4